MKDQDTSIYLKKLRFKKEYLSKISSKYLLNTRLVVLLLLSIVPIGILSMLTLPRRLNPEVEIPIVIVSTILPGAGPDEVESLVTEPIEESIANVENIDTYTSTSQDNVSVVSVEFTSTTKPEKAKDDIQSAVDSVNNLPANAFTPRVVAIDFENFPVHIFSLTTTSEDFSSLNSFSNTLKEKIEASPEIREVVVSGNEEVEIQILASPEKSLQNSINPFGLSSQIKASINAYPAGNLVANGSNVSASLPRTLNTLEDISNLPINSGSTIARLGDVTEVSKKSAPNQLTSFIADKDTKPSRSITFEVYKNTASTIENAANASINISENELINRENFQLRTISSSADEISNQFGELNESFILTLFLVFLTLFIFVGLKQSIIVAGSIPVTFLISFIVMSATGLSLNFLSVFSLLLALGLLVDDAIVIVSAMTTYYKTKKFSANETGLLVWKDFIVPIWSTTITTIWAFIPLLLSTGIIGEFIKTIPIVVTATLMASTSVAVLITLPATMNIFEPKIPSRVKNLLLLILLILMFGLFAVVVPNHSTILYTITIVIYVAFLLISFDIRNELLVSVKTLKTPKKLKTIGKRINELSSGGIIDATKISNAYFRIICKILPSISRRRTIITFTVIFAIFSYALVPLGFVKNEFFPKIDSDQISVQIELPGASSKEETTKETLKILDELRFLPELDFAIADIGRSVDSFDFSAQGSENVSRISMVLVDKKERERNSIQIAKNLRRLFSLHSRSKISVIEQSAGPPVGADLQIKFLGDDLQTLSSLADKTIEFIQTQPGTTNIEKSIKPSTSKLSFIPDESENVQKGLTNDLIGINLRTFASGFELADTQIDGEDTKITYRMFENNPTPDDLSRVKISSMKGPVALSDLGNFIIEPSPTKITREDGKRTISVTAAVEAGYSINDISVQLSKFADGQLDLPEGYSWKTGGVNEENESSVASIFQAMLISALLILGTMVLQLGSFRKSFIVFLVIPLAISGVFISFAITGTPLSFPALIGVLALFGIVVNNSIMVVEKINQNIAAKISFGSAIADAAASRVEPIMFSSLTTIMGLIPISITDPLWRGLGGAIISGLTISGAIMLFFIPVVYYSWFEKGKN